MLPNTVKKECKETIITNDNNELIWRMRNCIKKDMLKQLVFSFD